MSSNYLVYLAIAIVILVLVRKFLSRFKFPKINCLAVFTGDVKVGKSGVSLACAYSHYRVIHRSWRVRSFFRKIFRLEIAEEPLFYSNIPLAGINYCQLTTDHILRKKRFNFGSVVFVDEASLLADCYLSKDCKDLSTTLLAFFKLFGHETHSGYCIFNSQSVSDLHISLRKCTSQYFYIHDTNSSFFVPWFAWCHMREERYTEDGSTINTYDKDVEETLKTCIFRKKIFKQYDSHAYSILTDNLPVDNQKKFNNLGDDLKAQSLVSFRPEFLRLFEDIKKDKENNNNEK